MSIAKALNDKAETVTVAIGTREPDDGGGWIQTYTGKAFWPLDPDPKALDIVDIAHALAMKCRYTGHTRHFYSVAQHSVLSSDVMESEANDALLGGAAVTDAAKWGLLHDAPEAYLPDVARPVKDRLAGFRAVEDRLMQCIAGRFGLSWPMPVAVKQVDLILLATERRDLMGPPPRPWKSTERVEPLLTRIDPWTPEYATERFMRRWRELCAR